MAAVAPAAAEGLVASLARVQAELDWIRLRLEEEFARSCRKGEINTLALLTRLNKLRRRSELPEIQEECHRVLQAKQELVDAVKQGLGANTEQLRKLRRRAGIPTTAADDETYAAFTRTVEEHEAQLRVQYAEQGEFSREELNQAYVQSALA
ncbi:hypothetical protein C2E21_5572 [Chlorella sorokiniana]|uniref:Protein FAM33A n=1 Tax=Chlorella sorokiniana TaxID=3076 RepID=A0A2P6TNZ7_CHLSO|nr:hypothetical protein C2E21_5572 [Chlorella sorokiniana]|eukprot:PRW51055.1 hypothetical protein C2E21_5572 [Chlorella sorokiniana]